MTTYTLAASLIAVMLLGCVESLGAGEEVGLVGSIESIPQVSPLQIKVKTRDGSRLVQCAEETVVVRGKQKVNRDELKRGRHVIVSGRANGDIVLASKMELVDVTEGKIDAIMEVFPLRLAVMTKKGNVHVQLETETRVMRGKTKIDPGQLRNGDSVRVFGDSSGQLFVAKEIDVEASK